MILVEDVKKELLDKFEVMLNGWSDIESHNVSRFWDKIVYWKMMTTWL